MYTTLYRVASQFIGIKETAGIKDNPLVVAMLQLNDASVQHDETAWCSAFVNFVAFILDLPRSRSLRARSWLAIGSPANPQDAVVDCDIVIVKRGEGEQSGPEVLDAPGHVGLFAGWVDDTHTRVKVLGGNQTAAGTVCIQSYPAAWILGVRRLL